MTNTQDGPITEPTATPEGTPSATPQGTEGTPAGHASPDTPRTGIGSAPEQAPTFFDRQEWEEHLKTAPEESREYLRSLEKQLQGSYTKKTQTLAQERQKVEAYNAFMAEVQRDPVAAVNALVAQLGVDKQKIFGGGQASNDPWKEGFNSWEEVRDTLTPYIISQVQNQFAPLFGRVQNLTSQHVESQLSEVDPDWRVYEQDMMTNIKAHPTLVQDINKLYRLSVPEEVIQARADKKALKRFEQEAKAARVATGGSVQSSHAGADTVSMKPSSFDEAVKKAKEKLGWK